MDGRGADGKTVMNEVLKNGQTVLEAKTWIPYELGAAIVAVVVTLGVFLGGMRGTVWVNILQTTLFLCFGAVAVAVISHHLQKEQHHSFGEIISTLASDPKRSFLVTRASIQERFFWSYTLIPL